METILPGYTRVSDILSIFQAYAHVDRDKLKKAQDIGVVIHQAIEMFYSDEFKPLYGHYTRYFESFLKWSDSLGKNLNPLVVEKRFYDHELMITGRVDLLAELDGMIVLIDFKTGSWAHPEIWKLQACFYRSLIAQNITGQTPDKYLFIQLKGDGSMPSLFPMHYDIEDTLVCQDALRCYHYFKQKTPSDERG